MLNEVIEIIINDNEKNAANLRFFINLKFVFTCINRMKLT